MSKMTSPGEGPGQLLEAHPGSMGNACQSRRRWCAGGAGARLVVQGLERVKRRRGGRRRRRLGELLRVWRPPTAGGWTCPRRIPATSNRCPPAAIARRTPGGTFAPAHSARPPVGLGRRGLVIAGEPLADATVVGGEVAWRKVRPLADAAGRASPPGVGALDGGDRLRVEAELQHVGGLLGARRAWRRGLVAPRSRAVGCRCAPGSRRGRARRLARKGRLVMISAPARMASSVSGGGGKSQGSGSSRFTTWRPWAGGVQAGGFVLFALAAEEVGVVFGTWGRLAGAARDSRASRGEVGALDVVVEVGGGEDERPSMMHHRVSTIAATLDRWHLIDGRAA